MNPKFHKGPWQWYGNLNYSPGDLYLATAHSGQQYVMAFKKGNRPMFQPVKGNGMVDAKELATFEVGNKGADRAVGVTAAKKDPSVYRLHVQGIEAADAKLIADAPVVFELLYNQHARITECVNILTKYLSIPSTGPGETLDRLLGILDNKEIVADLEATGALIEKHCDPE